MTTHTNELVHAREMVVALQIRYNDVYTQLNEARRLIGKLQAELDQAPITPPVDSELRLLVAKYMYTEGCGCCSADKHDDLQTELCAKMQFPEFSDGSGYDYFAVAKGEDHD